MKQFKILGLFACLALFAMTSCKKDAEGTATTPVTNVANQGVNPNTSTTTPTPPKANEPAAPVGPLTTIAFEDTSYDFGEVMEGEKVVHEYKFTNTGKEPLIISNAKGSCGCTVPDWPREPIPAGESSVIKVQFDSKGKGKVGGGSQSKRVTITANTDPANQYLTIKGSVKKDEAAGTATPGK